MHVRAIFGTSEETFLLGPPFKQFWAHKNWAGGPFGTHTFSSDVVKFYMGPKTHCMILRLYLYKNKHKFLCKNTYAILFYKIKKKKKKTAVLNIPIIIMLFFFFFFLEALSLSSYDHVPLFIYLLLNIYFKFLSYHPNYKLLNFSYNLFFSLTLSPFFFLHV